MRGRPKGSKNKQKIKSEGIKPVGDIEAGKEEITKEESMPQTEGDDDGK